MNYTYGRIEDKEFLLLRLLVKGSELIWIEKCIYQAD